MTVNVVATSSWMTAGQLVVRGSRMIGTFGAAAAVAPTALRSLSESLS